MALAFLSATAAYSRSRSALPIGTGILLAVVPVLVGEWGCGCGRLISSVMSLTESEQSCNAATAGRGGGSRVDIDLSN
jgi:hypothetical protein